MSLIKEVITEYYRIPLPEIMEDAKHGLHTHFEVPIVKIITDDGREGVGYTYTGGFGGAIDLNFPLEKLLHNNQKYLDREPADINRIPSHAPIRSC